MNEALRALQELAAPAWKLKEVKHRKSENFNTLFTVTECGLVLPVSVGQVINSHAFTLIIVLYIVTNSNMRLYPKTSTCGISCNSEFTSSFTERENNLIDLITQFRQGDTLSTSCYHRPTIMGLSFNYFETSLNHISFQDQVVPLISQLSLSPALLKSFSLMHLDRSPCQVPMEELQYFLEEMILLNLLVLY